MKLRSLLLALFTVCLPGALSAAAITDLVGNAIATGTPTDRVPFTANSAGVYETFILTAVPGAPTSPVATRGNASASVAFTAPASNGGSAILSYTVTSSPGGLTGTGAASPISVSGLTNGTAYTFTVTATNAVGTGAASVASTAVTPATVPGAPTSPVATRGNGSASVAFVAPASNGGSAITGYTVTSSPGGFTGTGAGTPIVVSGLTNGTAYTFTVTATNAVGPGAPSAASAAVTPATVPGAPTSPVATAGNASASVAFTAPASNGGSAITGYTVTSSPGGITATGSTSPINVTGLTNGTPYTFTVTATNVVGPSAASAASNSVTPMAPAAVPTLTGVSPATGSTAGLTTVTLTGTNFTGATGVTFGGIAATGINVTSPTTLTCVTPARAAGAVSVVVTTPGGVNVGNTLYSYVDVLSSISGGTLTLSASTASDLTFTLVGSNMVVTSTNGGVVGPGGATSISFPLSSFPNGLVINGSSGIDTFTFDYSNGEPFPAGTVEVHGGAPSGAPPGDSILVTGGNFGDVAYNPGASGAGDIDLDGRTVSFTGLEPVDFSGSTIVNLTVNVDPDSTYVGNVITTIATADAGVNTNITFGSSGLESVKLGALTGTLTVNGDNVEHDYFQLDGLGSAMVGHFVVDGLGGDADVVEIDNTTVTVAGLNKNFTARADFIGIGALSALPTSPGVLVCSGNITLESNGPSGPLTADLIFGPDGTPGVWGLRSAKPEFGTNPFMRPGDIIARGRIEKPSGLPATLHLKAKDAVFMEGPTAPISSVLYGPSVIATAGVLNVLIQTDSDTLNNGHCTMRNATVTTNGGSLIIGGGTDPLNTPTNPSTGNGFGGVNLFATAITTNGGDVSMRGRGNVNIGVSLTSVANATNGACFIDAGSGDILVHGQVMTQGPSGVLNGVRLLGQSNGATLLPASLTTSGDITVTGINNVVGGNGVLLNRASAITSTGTGNVTVTGSGVGLATSTSGLGILLIPVANTTTQISSAGGNVTLVADKMNLNSLASDTTEVVSTTGSGIVTLKPLTAAVAVDLGSALDTNPSKLELHTLELDNITAGTLAIGDSSSGNIAVNSVIAPLNFKTLALSKNTTFSATSGFTSDVTSASVFEKVSVTGTVDITAGAALTMASTGGYIWNGTDAFTFLDNDLADAITGTFTGPTLTNFLGSALTATQSYAAGTGNDLVFSAPPSANADLSALTTTATGMTPAFGAATLTYNATVLNATTTTTVTATRAQANATLQVQVNGAGFSPLTSGVASGPLSLNVGANPIQVRVTAQDGTTIQTYTITVTRAAPAAPDAPTSVTGTAGDASASVAFTAPAFDGGSAILGYTVTSSPGGLTGTGAASPISVGGLTNGQAYTFTVTATNAIGTGAASAPSTAVTPRTVPGFPTSPVATPGDASASVAFTAPASNGGAAITSYTVTSSPGGFTGTGAASPISVSGLTNGTAYTFTVTATNVAGPGPASASSAAVTPRTVPGFPTSPVATAGNASASVAFTAPASNGGSAILSYTVTSSPGGFTGTGAASPISVTGLTNGTAYTFTVTATNAAGTSAASPASAAVTPRTVPGAPTSPVATPGNASASVAFTAPASTGGSAILSYTVTSSPGGFTGTGAASPISVTGLTNGTAYTFTVTATNAAGTGAASVPSAAVTPATVPGAPTSPVATGGNASASVAFSAPASDGGSAITLYTVTSNPGSFTGTGTASPVTVTGLTNGTPYTFTVRATNIMGQGPASVASASVTPSVPAVMNNYVVTTIADSDPASWTALELSTGKINGTNTVSLRSAVLAANQSGVGPHTISVPAALGTYVLSQTNPTNAATFSTNGGIDLVVGSHGSAITIQGTGGKAIIQRGTGGGAGDVITTGLKSDGFTPAIVNLTLDSLDITGGTFTAVFTGADDGLGNVSRTTISNSTLRNNTNADAAFGQGGAVQNTNGFLTLNNTIFTSNTATNSGAGQGGAVYYSLPNASGQGSVGALSITGCTFTSNTSGLASGVGGGAIYAQVNSAGTATLITGCTFTSNSATAGADGGAIVLDGSRAADVTNNDFVTNSVAGAGSGGALYVNNGAVNLNYNRFAGNTAATATNGGTLRRSASATGTVNANDNWWQSNLGPATNAVVGTVTQTSRINLKLVASPTSVNQNSPSALTADFFTTSSATTLTLPQVSTLIGRTVSFGSAVLGTYSGSQTAVQTAGTATSTFTSGLTPGAGSASVTIDGQTVTANITVTGPPPILVTGVNSSTANGTYKVGDNIAVTVTFDTAVVVTGTPQLTLETGATDRTVNYSSGSNSTALTFNYTVQAGDLSSDLDYISTSALALNGGTISPTSGTAAVILTLPTPGAAGSLGANKALVIDGVVPTVTSVNSSTSNGTFAIGGNINVQVNFSEVVNVTGTPQLTLETGATDRVLNYASGTGSSSLTFTYTVQADDTSADLDYQSTTALALNGGTIRDAATNNATLTLAAPGAAGSLGNAKALVIDGIRPTVGIVFADSAITVGETSLVTFTFSEAVVGFANVDLTIPNGSLSTVTSGDGITWTGTFTPATGILDTTNVITLNLAGVADAAGNAGIGNTDSNNFTIDTIVVTIAATTATAVEGATGLYTFTRNNSSGDLTVNFQLDASSTVTAATDFTLTSSGTHSFTAGSGAGTIVIPNGQTTATLTLTALAETVNAAEAAETARLNVVAGSGYAIGSPANATVTITENSFLVTTTSNSGTGSLRQAVLNANSIAGTDTITFSDGTGSTVNFTDASADTITLSGGQISLNSNLTIAGTGADVLIVQNTSAASTTSRVFVVPTGPAKTVRLSGLTLTGGNPNTAGGGLLVNSSSNATVSVIGCTIRNNSTAGVGGGVAQLSGALTIVNSTVSNNTAPLVTGSSGGIDCFGADAFTIINSTVSGNSITNSDSQNAGGIWAGATTTTIRNCTITNNTGTGGASGVIRGFGTVTVSNSIIAGNVNNATNPDVGGTFTSSGGNLIGNAGTATGFTNGVNSDQVGNGASPINPQLAALANNGGRTNTHALLASSTALNAGLAAQIPVDTFDVDLDSNTTEVIDVDQRGTTFLRSIGTVDIGAFELQKSVSILADAASAAEGTLPAGNTAFTFTVSRTGDTTGAVTMDYAVSGAAVNATDFGGTLPSGTVTIPDGSANTTLTIDVSKDTTVEPNEAFTVTLSNANNGYSIITATASSTINNDDTATVIVAKVNDGAETNTPAAGLFRLTQSAASSVDTTVAYTVGGTATSGTDFTALSGTATITAGTTTADISVTVLNDALVELTETVTVTINTITSVNNVTAGTTLNASLDITDNDTATVTIAKITDGAETPTSALFRVTQTATATSDTVLTYTLGGTATSGSDYTAPSGSVTILAGQTTADITVAITNDALVEATETLSLTLTGFTARDADVSLGTTLLATADITDNDTATVSIARINDGAETNTPVAGLFRVTQTAASSTDTTLTYSVTGSAVSGTDFTALSGSITVPAGQTTADISVTVLNDNIVEATETITVTLTGFTARDPDIALSSVPSATAAIVDVTDNDMATVSLAKINDGVEATVATNALFRVTQTAVSSTNTVIAYTVGGTATSGSDFTALSGSVTIIAGQTTADISVAVLNETLVEGTETVTLTMSSITSGDTDITLLAPLSASADITDNDTATATIAKTTDGNEAGPVSAVFTVSLSAASSTDTTLNYSVGGTATSGSDFTAPSGSVIVPANSTSATVTVTVANDALVEATETLSLTLTGVSGDPDISLGSTVLATADISDNDTATVSIANLANGAEPATNGSFRVTQSAVSSTDTVVNYAITGTAISGTDFTALSGSVTITAGQTTADISVPVIDELLVEATETVIATLNGFGAHDADITLSTTVAATVDITDNDTATVTLAKITDGIELAVPTNALFRVTQTAAASVDSVISYTVGGTATSGTDFTALTGSVTILAGNTTADISVAVLNENVVEATETVSLTLTGFTARDPEVTLGTTLTDSADITDSDTATVTLAAVSADKDEGTGGTTTAFTFSATLSNPVQGGFSIAYTTNDGTALAASDYTDNDSSLSFTGAAEAQTITVLVTHDGTNEIDESFTVALGAITGTTLGGSLSVIASPQTGTIRNDDALTVTIAATDADADENTAGTGIYRITRNGVLGNTTVQLAIDASSSAAAADWTQSGATFASLAPSSAGTAIIPDGSTFVDISLTPSADLHAEAAETVRLNITADAAYVIGSPADATVTIGQNDFLVINTNDAGEGTLRQAVLNANALAGDDTITFDATAFATAQTITLTSGQIVISSNVIVEGTGLLTLNGNATSRIFNISGATVILSDLTLTNGSTTSWGGALNVVNASFVTVQRCTVSNSTSALEGGGIYVNNGTLNVVSSTISGNTATTVGGGAIATGTSVANATVNVTNSTISGNTGANGGAMLFGSNAVVSLLHTTVTNNTSTQGPNVWSGGGAVTVANSIIAANQINTGHDDVGGAFTSSGGNLIGLGGGATGFTHGTNNDQFGAGTPINPLLGPLQDNGGPTLTHMPLNGSPAINNGLVANLPLDTNDQRGAPNLRQRGPAPDSGAVEAFAFEPTLTVATTDEDVKTTSGLVITANSADGDLTTHYQITSILNGTLYKTDGSTVIAGNSFITKAEGLAGLKFLPDTNKNDPNTATGFGFTAQAAISAAEADLRGETVDVEITVNPVADTPSVTGTFTVTSTQSTDGLVITRNTGDSTEVTHFKITNIQNGTLYQNNGTTAIAANSFITVAQGGAGLKFTPAGGFVGSTSFTVQGAVDNVGTGLSPSASAEINVGYPAPRITVLGPLVLNRKNGLYEHTVRITNAYVVPMDGFRLTNTNLLPEVQMWNRTHAYLPVIENSVDLGAFSSRDVLVQYYSRERDIIEWEPTYSADNLTDPEIAVLPPDLSGLWHGLASRSTQPIFSPNPAVGARLEVKVNTSGVLSGKVTEGKTVKPFTARISGYVNLGETFGGLLESLVNQSNLNVPIPGGDVASLLAPYALTVIKGKTPAQDVYLAVIFIPEVNLMIGIMGGPDVLEAIDGLLGGLDGGNTRQGDVAELDDAGDEVETLLNLPFSIFLGWRNIWGMPIEGDRDRLAGPASPVATYQPTPYLARHHFAMAPTEVPDIGGIGTLNTVQALSAPEGFSFGTLVPLNVAKKRGDYTVAGRLADGTSFTCSSFYGQYGQCLVHSSLYGHRGSLLGLLLIIPGEEIADNDVLGILTWLKPSPLGTAKPGRNYGHGFSLFMEAQGGTYTRPAKGQIVMGLQQAPRGVANAWMSFEGAGLPSPVNQFMRAASSGLSSLANTLAPTMPNPSAVDITSFSAATGLIKGSFTAVPRRAASFRALIVPTANNELPDLEENGVLPPPVREQTGYGYFLLPQVPVAPQTSKTAPILSGRVYLTPNVD